MKIVRIDGKPAKVFVLKETDESLVYIPVSSLFRVDYERLLKIEEKGGEMLRELARTTLDNGRNALVTYDGVIQVMRYTDSTKESGKRVRKANEAPPKQQGNASNNGDVSAILGGLEKFIQVASELVSMKKEEPATDSAPEKPRKKPGPKPGTPRPKARNRVEEIVNPPAK